MSQAVMVVLYARVSSDQQAKRGTSESQIAALTKQIVADDANVADDLRFVEAGVSGATLIRPQLERLRDRAALDLVDRDDGVRKGVPPDEEPRQWCLRRCGWSRVAIALARYHIR
jgi:site-specific DNA recombinase